MPGNLRLRLAQNLDEVANTNLLIPHKVQEAKPRVVSQSLEESLDVERFLFRGHASIIFVLTDVSTGNIFTLTDMSEVSRGRTNARSSAVEVRSGRGK